MKRAKRVRMLTHEQVLREFFKEPGFREGYEEELNKLRLMDALVGLRQRLGLTQAALAKRLKVSQPFIAKLERMETHNFTLDTLLKFVEALDGELVIKIRHRPRAKRNPYTSPKESAAIRRNRRLMAKLRVGHREAKQRRGRFIG